MPPAGSGGGVNRRTSRLQALVAFDAAVAFDATGAAARVDVSANGLVHRTFLLMTGIGQLLNHTET